MTYVYFLLLVFGVATTGALFPPGDWYSGLEKPLGTPPPWVFGPVWTALYLGIAVAGARLWRAAAGAARSRALGLYAAQLLLNAAWSWLCFGLHQLGWALVDLTVLLPILVLLVRTARAVSAMAAWLLVPYACWVGYATWLNAGLFWLNRG
ncbi:MAG: tryptophan-rich sensory protein [Planctomycetota bacterium]|nr:tryptophan-rich sensory protein [Planctomycetota bacterium]MDA0931988.1 tryptophan-rich sensory protein [Planctomycetota bacterium]MDA1222696.1 tryptophan-rich sensory protein [Planctomycetota bacterium]